MDPIVMTVMPILGGLFLYALIHAGVRQPGSELRQKFVQAGNLQGKTLQEITALVGPPKSRSALPGGKVLHQWMATGYHIALRFDPNGVCEGVTHESAG